jgi:hypothetical protein
MLLDELYCGHNENITIKIENKWIY